MIISEDGSVTGSIDVNALDEVEPKSDEAKAQLDALKAERDAGRKAADADAARLAELHASQSAAGQAEVTTPAGQVGDANPAAQKDAEAKTDDKAPAKKAAASHSSTDKG